MFSNLLCGLLYAVIQGQAARAHSQVWDVAAVLQCTNNPAGPLSPLAGYATCPLPVDDEALKSGVWSPWSYPPVCMRPKNKSGPKLCAFTLSSLRGEGGMSIVTTPRVASDLAKAARDPDIAWLEKQRGSPFMADRPKPYEIRALPGKGLGVMAAEPIRRGQVVMVALPILLQLADTKPWDYRDVFRLLQEASIQLPRREKEALLQMAKRGRGYVVDDIMKTNSFQVTINGVGHSGLYPEISVWIYVHARTHLVVNARSCIVRYSPSTLIVEVVAYRDIERGEELSLSYIPLNLLSEQRQDVIKGWGFNCTCALCRDTEATKVSDSHRARIQAIFDELDAPENRTHEKVQAAMTELEELVEEEGLAAQIGDLHTIFADLYLDMGDSQKAREHAGLALGMLRQFAGWDNDRTNSAASLVTRLEEEKKNV
ncbi:hypothetical protein B0T25DRAFT_505015 [Lasiosphaeria hispida]|uniref:SET domain-containing protein n=1 Tax=Lasiosphaeria hispida TaxID=260671 RepID=A0AAJ0HFK0_9PEZI|nr:hypothetical protein B0T25DRAFT_505015 [Lasiosphaeria hispida]